jgi:hypothetical protein
MNLQPRRLGLEKSATMNERLKSAPSRTTPRNEHASPASSSISKPRKARSPPPYRRRISEVVTTAPSSFRTRSLVVGLMELHLANSPWYSRAFICLAGTISKWFRSLPRWMILSPSGDGASSTDRRFTNASGGRKIVQSAFERRGQLVFRAMVGETPPARAHQVR